MQVRNHAAAYHTFEKSCASNNVQLRSYTRPTAISADAQANKTTPRRVEWAHREPYKRCVSRKAHAHVIITARMFLSRIPYFVHNSLRCAWRNSLEGPGFSLNEVETFLSDCCGAFCRVSVIRTGSPFHTPTWQLGDWRGLMQLIKLVKLCFAIRLALRMCVRFCLRGVTLL